MHDRNQVRIEDRLLVVKPRGWDKLWTLRRQVSIPLASIATVDVNRRPHRIHVGSRRSGLDFMGKLAGTFNRNGARQFWNYAGIGAALCIVIKPGGAFQEIYLSVNDPDLTADAIRDAI